MGKIATNNGYNSGTYMGVYETVEGMLQFPVAEAKIDGIVQYIIYYLGYDFRVIKAVQSEPLERLWNVYVKEGKLDPVDWGQFQVYLRDTVTYWTDSGWVTEGQLRAAEGIK
jgi:hypothetical protein